MFVLFSTNSMSQTKLIVPFAVGGAVDQMARVFAKYVETNLGEEIVIENVTGAGSIVGTHKLLSSNSNKTILFTTNSHYANISKGHFKEEDFKVVSMIGETPYLILGSKTKNLTCNDLRNTKRQFFIGTAGKDSSSSSAAEFIIKKHSHFTEVPYRGISAALTDVLADRIDITFSIGNTHVRPDVVVIANTSNKKINNILSWKECLGISDNFNAEYLIVSKSDASIEFLNRMNRHAFRFAKDYNTANYFKELGIIDTTTNFSETEQRAKEILESWKRSNNK